MKRKKDGQPLRDERLKFCGELNEDDGVDPRTYFKPSRRQAKENKKAKQLCRQVQQTLNYVLTDCDDEQIQWLFVTQVVPAPDSSCVLVLIEYGGRPEEFNRIDLLSRLADQTGRLRLEVGRSIHRKRVPNLTFSVGLPVQGGDADA